MLIFTMKVMFINCMFYWNGKDNDTETNIQRKLGCDVAQLRVRRGSITVRRASVRVRRGSVRVRLGSVRVQRGSVRVRRG
jgi:hypothetical protein